MKLHFLLTGVILAGATVANGQSKFQQDREAIKAMQGCYKVTFNFAETFSPDTAYVKKDNYTSWAHEYVKLIDDQPEHLKLQHLLIVNEDTPNPIIIKHWRQDWDYQNTDFYDFVQYNPETRGEEWIYESKTPEEVEGQWTQKVYQVDDSPRYEGSATWVHYDGRHYWENETNAPLPRREYSTRHDYNLMSRKNRHEITSNGWVHEQDNKKILHKGKEDILIAQEKGWNTYERVDDKLCEPAEKWWQENKGIWKNVRSAWDKKLAQRKDLYLWPKKGVKAMYKGFFKLDENSNVDDAYEIIEEFSKKD